MPFEQRRILVIGRSGQLARCLADTVPDSVHATFLGREEADFSAPVDWSALFAAHKPDLVINAAAYTAVDRAESEPTLAATVNGEGVALLGAACAGHDVPVLHFSTDYAFDGALGRPYLETDAALPINAYGRSKVAGEIGLLGSSARATVFRTSWVHSAYGANFVKTMIRVGGQRGEVGVVDDQFGCPTSAHELARVVWRVLPKLLTNDDAVRGLFHVRGGDAPEARTSWHTFAAEILSVGKAVGLVGEVSVNPIPSSEYPTPAARPVDCRLDMTRFERVFGEKLPPWQQSLVPLLESLRDQSQSEQQQP